MGIILFWVIFSLIVGIAGSDTSMGFLGSFFLSLLLSPIIGFIIVLILPSEKDIRKRNAASVSTADELAKFKQLHTDGVISDAEFIKQRKRLLNN